MCDEAAKCMKVALIPGDGIGPEVIRQAVKVLEKTAEKRGHKFEFREVLMGGAAIDETGVPLPEETIGVCKSSQAVLLGAVGGLKWDVLPGNLRPEAGLLGLRKELQAYANLRPAVLFPQLKQASALKEEVLEAGLDVLVVRELTGGLYFGDRGRSGSGSKQRAWDTMTYTAEEIDRVAKVAFDMAGDRKKKLTLVDKANVLESSRLWRERVNIIAAEYPEVDTSYMYVDNAAMQLVRNPGQFDVILTENLFGDILSDEASMLTGSLGMLPSASIGGGTAGLYEPIHGSAPDIAGQDKANPIATILSAAMMLRISFGRHEEAEEIEKAVQKVLDEGYRTADIMQKSMKQVGTEEMGSRIANML